MASEDYEGTTIGYLTDLTVPMVRLGVASKSRDPALYTIFEHYITFEENQRP